MLRRAFLYKDGYLLWLISHYQVVFVRTWHGGCWVDRQRIEVPLTSYQRPMCVGALNLINSFLLVYLLSMLGKVGSEWVLAIHPLVNEDWHGILLSLHRLDMLLLITYVGTNLLLLLLLLHVLLLVLSGDLSLAQGDALGGKWALRLDRGLVDWLLADWLLLTASLLRLLSLGWGWALNYFPARSVEVKGRLGLRMRLRRANLSWRLVLNARLILALFFIFTLQDLWLNQFLEIRVGLIYPCRLTR